MKKKNIKNPTFDIADIKAPECRPEADILADLETVCISPGYAHALSFICWRENFISYDGEIGPDDLNKSEGMERILRSEISLLTRLMCSAEIDISFQEPVTVERYISDSERLLHELHESMNIYFFDSIKESSVDQSISHGSPKSLYLREPIFYAGESALNFQYAQLSEQRYEADTQWLMENVGFSSRDVLLFCNEIEELQLKKLEQLRESTTLENIHHLTLLPAFMSNVDEISSASGLKVGTVRAIIRAFSPSFIPSSEKYREIGSWNELAARPIVIINGDSFILFQAYSLVESAYESPFYWMYSDRKYRDKASKNRGAFTEKFAFDCLRKLFGGDRVYQNVVIYNKRGETVGEVDVLLLYGDRALVLQAKSKRLTEAARKGVNRALENDFEKAVQCAYDQGFECAEYLKSDNCKFVIESGSELDINKKIKEIFIICLVADSFPGLAYYADKFIKLKTHKQIREPYIIDVFLLDVLCEILDSPLYFFSFLNRRHMYARKLHSSNELSILGFHLSHNLWFDDNADFINLGEDFTAPIDAAMFARRKGLSTRVTPEGILTRNKGTYFGHLIEQIGHFEADNIIDLGYLLLMIGEKSAKDIAEAIKHICMSSKEDGRRHDFSMSFGTSGLTVHTGFERDGEAFNILYSHCEFCKYRAKADSWYGIQLKVLPVGDIRFIVGVDAIWEHDPVLDEALRKSNSKPAVKNLKRAFLSNGRIKKIGVNQLCSCGSGRKYKKCCMNKV